MSVPRTATRCSFRTGRQEADRRTDGQARTPPHTHTDAHTHTRAHTHTHTHADAHKQTDKSTTHPRDRSKGVQRLRVQAYGCRVPRGHRPMACQINRTGADQQSNQASQRHVAQACTRSRARGVRQPKRKRRGGTPAAVRGHLGRRGHQGAPGPGRSPRINLRRRKGYASQQGTC